MTSEEFTAQCSAYLPPRERILLDEALDLHSERLQESDPDLGREFDAMVAKLGKLGLVRRNKRMTPPEFEYEGRVYVRPVSRGVVMYDDDALPEGYELPCYVEDAVRDGYYRMKISFEKLTPAEEIQAAEDFRHPGDSHA